MSDRCLYGSEHIGVPCVYCERNEWKARWNTLMSLAREMMVGDAPVGQATGRPRLSKSAAQQLVGIMLDLEDALEAVRRKRRVGDAPDGSQERVWQTTGQDQGTGRFGGAGCTYAHCIRCRGGTREPSAGSARWRDGSSLSADTMQTG